MFEESVLQLQRCVSLIKEYLHFKLNNYFQWHNIYVRFYMGKGKSRRRQPQAKLNEQKQVVQKEQPQSITPKPEVLSEQEQVKLSVSKLESEVKELEQELEILRNSLHQKAQQLSDKRIELNAMELKDVDFQNKKAEAERKARLKDAKSQLSTLLEMGDTEGIEQWIIANRDAVPELKSVIGLYNIEQCVSPFIKLDYAVNEILEYATDLYDITWLILKILSDPNLINSKSFDKEKMYDSLIARVSQGALYSALSLSDVIMAISDAYKEQFINIIFERVQRLDMHHSLLEFAKKVNDEAIEYAMQEAFKYMLTESEFSHLLQPWMTHIRISAEDLDNLRQKIAPGKEWYINRIAELQACDYEEKQEVVEVVDLNQQIDYKAKLESKPTQVELDELLRNAVTYEDLDSVQLLMSNGAYPFATDNYGTTALEIAVSHFSDNQIEIVRAMIPDASVTPYLIELAQERNNIELLSLFKQMAVEHSNERVIGIASTALDALDESNKIKASIAGIVPRLPLERGEDKEWPELG